MRNNVTSTSYCRAPTARWPLLHEDGVNPGSRLTAPLRAAALAELRALGRKLDRQVTERTGAGEREVEATLRLMKQVHTGIVTGAYLDA